MSEGDFGFSAHFTKERTSWGVHQQGRQNNVLLDTLIDGIRGWSRQDVGGGGYSIESVGETECPGA